MPGEQAPRTFVESISAFKDAVKAQILNMVNMIKNSKEYIKQSMQAASQWCIRQASSAKENIKNGLLRSYQITRQAMVYAFNGLSYIFLNLPHLVSRFVQSSWRIFIRSLRFGYWFALEILNALWATVKLIGRGLKHLIMYLPYYLNVIKDFVIDVVKSLFHFAKKLIIDTLRAVKYIFVGLKDLVVESIYALGRLCRFIYNNFRPLLVALVRNIYFMISHIPALIGRLYLISIDLSWLLKDALVSVAKHIYRFSRIFLTEMGHFLKAFVSNVFQISFNILKKGISYLLQGFGLVLGIGAAIFELGIDLVKDLFWRQPSPTLINNRQLPRQSTDNSVGADLVIRDHVAALTPQFQRQSENLANAHADTSVATTLDEGRNVQNRCA